MRNQIEKLLSKEGQSPVIHAIDKTIADLKRLDYTRGEIKETLREWFYGLDGNVDSYIISKGY